MKVIIALKGYRHRVKIGPNKLRTHAGSEKRKTHHTPYFLWNFFVENKWEGAVQWSEFKISDITNYFS